MKLVSARRSTIPQDGAEDLNLPQFIRVDLKEKTLSGVGTTADRSTPRDFVERRSGDIISAPCTAL